MRINGLAQSISCFPYLLLRCFPYTGALDGGSLCRMSNLRNVHVPCHYFCYFHVHFKLAQCRMSILRNSNKSLLKGFRFSVTYKPYRLYYINWITWVCLVAKLCKGYYHFNALFSVTLQVCHCVPELKAIILVNTPPN